ncbi:MAG: peptidase M23 [Gammaproteobacteria bacterium]|nr:peptidase M23 [Gammaproteobacteria bacterium]
MRACLFICFLLSLLISKAYGENQDASTDSNETGNLESAELQQQKDELLGLLAQVDERYGDVAASLRSIEAEMKDISGSLDKIRKEADAYQHQIEKLDMELSAQVKAAYALGQQDKLKLMLNQQDPALSNRMMVYYEYLNKSRLKKLTDLQQLTRYLGQLDEQKRSETERLEKNLLQKKSEQTALDDVRKQRNNLLAKLNGEGYSKEDQLRLLQDSENKLINLIQKLKHDEEDINQIAEEGDAEGAGTNDQFPALDGDFASLKGKLPLPVHGKLASMFDDSSTDNTWKGILINAKEGAEIKAVTKGKVVYADNLRGYGQLIIVEHDKEFMTLYAFNQSLYKHKGDPVEAGEVIAAVGQSGGRSKPGLYFEIRKNGKPVDPLLWCRN